MKHWEWIIDWLRINHDELKSWNLTEFSDLPQRDDTGKLVVFAKIPLREVINKLSEVKFSDEQDVDLKRKWTHLLSREIFSWFQVSCPTGFRYRNKTKLLRFFFRAQKIIGNVIEVIGKINESTSPARLLLN